jgi:hypothetical protein
MARASVVLLAALALAGTIAHVVWVLVGRRTLEHIALDIERVAGAQQNALLTWAESRGREVAPYMFKRLERQARDELARVDARAVAPVARAAWSAVALAAVAALALALWLVAPEAFRHEAGRLLFLAPDVRVARNETKVPAREAGAAGHVEIESCRVRVAPPAYSGLSVEEIAGDGPVRALAGSTIEVILRAQGQVEGATLAFAGAQRAMRDLGDGTFSATFVAAESGAFEARLVADERATPAPVVRAIEVYADAAPEPRIIAPERDQLLRAVPDDPTIVRWTARDDLGLASVMLKYVMSHGEGDAAKSLSGEARPASAERVNEREWRGACALDLKRLGMQPGDTIVFWIEARDRNPAADSAGRSASLSIAIMVPEPVKLNLSDLRPGEIGRFLLSQRQIIINTEKLHAERARLSHDQLVRRANVIAADQREFKNSFNDFIEIKGSGTHAEPDHHEGAGAQVGPQAEASGNQVENIERQVREAEDERMKAHDHGVAEPPVNAPVSVRELVQAIRAMWDAEGALVNADTAAALVHERAALAHLKRAQAAVRYVPPVVARTAPVDLKRRYAGELAEIKTRLERLARTGNGAKDLVPVREALADVYAALRELHAALDAPADASREAFARAGARARRAADRLAPASGGAVALIAATIGHLRAVETELGRAETGDQAGFAAERATKLLQQLTQAASTLFAIAGTRTRATRTDAGLRLPADDARAAEYFRRLANGGRQR